MSRTKEEKIKQAVDLLIDKDTDLRSFFGKDGILRQLAKNLFERTLKAEYAIVYFDALVVISKTG